MRVKLGDVCERGSSNLKQSDVAENNGDYEIYGASGLIGKVDFFHQDKPYIAVVKDGAGIGRTMLLPEKSSVIGTMQYLLPNEKVLPRYLYYVVRYMHLEKYFTGATIPHIYFKDYKNEEFNLCDLSEQEKIISSLSTIESIITHHRTQLEKLDELIKARFVEMFGDPVSNPMGWDIVTFDDCLRNIENGKSFVCDADSRIGSEPAILKLSAATYGFYIPEENKAIISVEDYIESAEVHDGDLLFTRKNTPELVGMAAYVFSTPQNLMMPDLIFRLNTKPNCNKIYLWKLINHELYRECIKSIANGSAKSMSNISKERLKKLCLPLPPLELQNQFADFVTQTDKSKFIEKEVSQ